MDAYGKDSFQLWGGTATLLTADPAASALVRRVAEQVIAEIDAACSGHRPDSELAAVNASAGRPVPVGPVFLDVLTASLGAARATGGLVDPTAARPPDVKATQPIPIRRFAVPGLPAPVLNRVPDPDLGEEEPERPGAGWRTVEVDDARGTVTLPPGLALDFGAIGKAYAADRAAERAAAAAGCGVVVALAGDVAVCGPVPADGWPVRIPDDHRTGPAGVRSAGQDITLHVPGGLATSSLSVRARTLRDGRTVSHIIDPRTGQPVSGPWQTASVAADSCVLANTASTAALIKGRGAAHWLISRGLPSRLTHTDGWVTRVSGWPADPHYLGDKVAG